CRAPQCAFAVGAVVSGSDPGEGALWGAASAVATGLTKFYMEDEPRLSKDGHEFGSKDYPGPHLVAEEKGLWAALLGDPFSHAFWAFGDGTFADSQNCDPACTSGTFK